MLARIDTERAHERQSTAIRLSEKRGQMEQLNARLLRLKELMLDGVIGTEEGRADRAKLLGKLKTTQDECDALSRGGNAWLEPFKEWISTAQTLGEVARTGSLTAKKVLARKVFGSNLVLREKKASGEAVKPWATLAKTATGLTGAEVFDAARTFFRENYPSR